MDKQTHLYDFRIDAWAPDTLPMSRLADYLAQLATLFGNKDHVHFVKVVKGSAVPVISVENTAQPKVEARLRLVDTSDAPKELSNAKQRINEMLREDNASAYIRPRGGAKILEFKGAKTPLAEEVVLYEQGELDGTVIRIGGKDETVPVMLEGENGQYFRCNTKRDIAKNLASHIFGAQVRVSGKGKWRRNQQGEWELDLFDIQSFEALDDTPLQDVIAGLRAIDGSQWNDMAAPQEELKKLRGE